MKIAIIIPVWQRPQILKACIAGMERLSKMPNHEIIPIFIPSLEDKTGALQMVLKSGFINSIHPNQPLGKKYNHGMVVARAVQPDAVMVSGSDDLYDEKYINFVADSMGKGFELAGSIDVYLYNAKAKTTHYWPGYKNRRRGEMIGMGRTLSKRLLDWINWKPWDDNISSSLDHSMLQTLRKSKCTIRKSKCYLKKNNIRIMDIKSDQSITKIGGFPDLIKAPDMFIKELSLI